MTKSILLDTDILVDFLRGHDKAVTFVTAHSDRIVLSAVVVAELYSGVKGDAEKAVLDSDIVDIGSPFLQIGSEDSGEAYEIEVADAEPILEI